LSAVRSKCFKLKVRVHGLRGQDREANSNPVTEDGREGGMKKGDIKKQGPRKSGSVMGIFWEWERIVEA